MLRSSIALAASLFLTTIAAAQEAAPDVAELKRLLAWFLDGASRNDAAVHERFWAEELVYTRSAGVRTDKAGILADVRKGADPAEPPTAYSAEDVDVRQYGDTAIVAFRLVGKVGGDNPDTLNFLNTGTFLKRNGEWRAIAWQATRMPLAPAQDAPVNLTPGAMARPGLAEEIRRADAEFFRAFFDTCDVDTVRRYIADDFEMIHDKGGIVATSGAQFVQETVDKCKRQAEGTDFLSTRKLVADTLKVYPIQQDGAIATGTHTFYAVKAGKPDRLTETGQFTTFWKQVDGQWKMMRALSYDHVLAQ
ncbi:MAG TPA: nuclear transport factor 2 family protein [Steroidobacteraceae bacterium]|nr:nuclear transport factor 2 family protein [Steroidobacteraceae bacterium]